MSRLQTLKVFINQRLTAAVEEVIGRLEKAITEYEEEMEGRQRRLLDMASEPEDGRQTAVFFADVQQQLVIKEEVLYEKQEWSSTLDQEDPEHPHMKEENQDFSFPSMHVPVKTEDEEKSQPSQVHQKQTEENREAEPPASSSTAQMKTEGDGEVYQGPEAGRIFVSNFKCLTGSDDKTSHSSEAEIEDSGDDWKVRKPQTDLNKEKNKVPVSHLGPNTDIKSFSCSKCGKRFGQKHHLQIHMRCHTGEKPFSCSLCGKRFTQKGNLTQHLTVHTREKPCSCPVCGERFSQKGNLTQHMTVHTREKLCW